jgi:hypothetical protein
MYIYICVCVCVCVMDEIGRGWELIKDEAYLPSIQCPLHGQKCIWEASVVNNLLNFHY